MRHHPPFDEFVRLAGQGNLVPVYRQLTGDTLTPVSAFCKIQEGDWAHPNLHLVVDGDEFLFPRRVVEALAPSCRGDGRPAQPDRLGGDGVPDFTGQLQNASRRDGPGSHGRAEAFAALEAVRSKLAFLTRRQANLSQGLLRFRCNALPRPWR